MVKRVLITRPTHDIVTSYLHDFSQGIVKVIKGTKDIHITDLEGNQATRENLEKSASKENPGLIFLNGHGNRKIVTGHNNDPILDEKNIELTKDKIIYALSCDSLEDLGELAVQKGAKAYIGYKARFMFVTDPTRVGSPNKDKNALPFRRACFALINSLVFGNSVSKAIELTKEEYNHSIRSYGTSEDDPYGDAPLIRFALTWNLEFLDMHGDPEASFN
ncbi:hypothetical protein JXB27_00070 [Candidatus Woesearchaeota archaeon]|nr:hypothetical protein [Candidatus Woesearchaeota archaeon]